MTNQLTEDHLNQIEMEANAFARDNYSENKNGFYHGYKEAATKYLLRIKQLEEGLKWIHYNYTLILNSEEYTNSGIEKIEQLITNKQ